MSTTATVSPYDPERQRQLAKEEMKCQAAIERYRAERRTGRITTSRVALNVRTMEPLTRAAESLGYRLDAPPTRRASVEPPARVSLARSSGEVLVIERSQSGRLIANASGSPEAIHRVVREYVVAEARAHLQAKGMDVRVRHLPTGEIQLEGRERDTSRLDGQASVTAAVGLEGTMRVDVGCLKGQRCEEIVVGLARAVEGDCMEVRRKPEFFQAGGAVEDRLRV
jgi:hypothetical protein